MNYKIYLEELMSKGRYRVYKDPVMTAVNCTDIEREEFAGYCLEADITARNVNAMQHIKEIFSHAEWLPDLIFNCMIGSIDDDEKLGNYIRTHVVVHYEDHMQALLTHAWAEAEKDKAMR